MSVFESLQNLLIACGVSLSQGVLNVLQQRMLVAHLHEVLCQLVLIEQVLRAFQIVLVLLSQERTLNVWVDPQLQVLSLVSLCYLSHKEEGGTLI